MERKDEILVFTNFLSLVLISRMIALLVILFIKNLKFYEILLAELRLEDKHNCNILLRVPSESLEEIFQLIKDGITKENTKMRELILPRLQHAATIGLLSTEELYKSYVYEHYSFYSTMNSSSFTSFRAFVFSIFLL